MSFEKLKNIFTRGAIKLVDDTQGLQFCQTELLADEVHDNIERLQNYGFTSSPAITGDPEAAVFFIAGNRDHGIIVAMDDRRFRLRNLERGEVAIYTDEGDKIVLKRGRKMDIITDELTITANVKITLNAPTVEINSPTKTEINAGLLESNSANTKQNAAVSYSIKSPIVNIDP